jgi:hypothetical protein
MFIWGIALLSAETFYESPAVVAGVVMAAVAVGIADVMVTTEAVVVVEVVVSTESAIRNQRKSNFEGMEPGKPGPTRAMGELAFAGSSGVGWWRTGFECCFLISQ